MTARLIHLGLALLLLPLLALGACQDPAGPGADGPPIDESMPALVGMAESYHVQADVAVERGALDEAADAMTALTDELDAYAGESEEVRMLALDAYTRLARIRLDQGRPEDALAVADRGLEIGGETADRSIFGGYLHQTRGNIQIELGDDLGGVESHRSAILVFKALLEANEAQRAAPAADDAVP